MNTNYNGKIFKILCEETDISYMKKINLKNPINYEQSIQNPHPHGACISFRETISKSANYGKNTLWKEK